LASKSGGICLSISLVLLKIFARLHPASFERDDKSGSKTWKDFGVITAALASIICAEMRRTGSFVIGFFPQKVVMGLKK
jgi:hypothetical protein